MGIPEHLESSSYLSAFSPWSRLHRFQLSWLWQVEHLSKKLCHGTIKHKSLERNLNGWAPPLLKQWLKMTYFDQWNRRACWLNGAYTYCFLCMKDALIQIFRYFLFKVKTDCMHSEHVQNCLRKDTKQKKAETNIMMEPSCLQLSLLLLKRHHENEPNLESAVMILASVSHI